MRRRTNTKNKSVEERVPKIARFHIKLRKVMRRIAVCRNGSEGATASDEGEVESKPATDPVFGRFQLNERFNADQVGLAFINGVETTYDVTETTRVHVSQPLVGLETR